MVGDEMGEKVVAIQFRAAEKLTAATLKLLFKKLLEGMGKVHYQLTSNQENVHKFVKDGQQTQGIEITKAEMCGFDRYARKYHFEYSMVREKNDKTKYVFLFKAKDIDRMENAMRDFFKDGREHSSLKEKITEARQKALSINQARAKEKAKEHMKTKGSNRGVER